MYDASYGDELVRGLPHCVRNDGWEEATAKHCYLNAVMQSEAKHPLWRDRGGVRVAVHPMGMSLSGGFLTAFGMTAGRKRTASTPFDTCHAERIEASPVA